MINLILKDIIFNKKQAALFLALLILVPVICVLDQETRFTLFIFILFPVAINSLFIPKTCYRDDNEHSKRLLASLPILKTQLVGAKYVLALICMGVSIALLSGSALICGIQFHLQSIVIAVSYMLLYYAFYLFTFYRSNYSNAEKANAALLMITVASLFTIDRNGINLDTVMLSPGIIAAILAVSGAAFALSYIVSIKFYKMAK